MTSVVLIGALLGVAVFAVALAPLWRRRKTVAPPRIAHEVEALKSALADIARERRRGALSEAEAESAEREIARRLLAADAAAVEAPEFGRTPARPARIAALVSGALLVLGALGLHQLLGAPAAPDRPFADRDPAVERAVRMSQADAEAAFRAASPPPPLDPSMAEMMERLETRLGERPTDREGLQLLASSYAQLGRPERVWPALRRLAELEGAADAPAVLMQIGDLMMSAAGGYVSSDAVAAFERAADVVPGARFFLGLAALQGNDPQGALEALRIWGAFYRDYEAAAFAPMVRSRILEVASALGINAEALLGRIGGLPSVALEGLLLAAGARALGAPENYEAWATLMRRYRAIGRPEAALALAEIANRFVGGRPEAFNALRAAQFQPWADATEPRR